MLKLKLGVDVGRAFTDVVGITGEGKVYFAKTPCTPQVLQVFWGFGRNPKCCWTAWMHRQNACPVSSSWDNCSCQYTA